MTHLFVGIDLRQSTTIEDLYHFLDFFGITSEGTADIRELDEKGCVTGLRIYYPLASLGPALHPTGP